MLQQTSLAGSWSFALDRDRVGINQRWHRRETLDDSIKLPGSVDEARKAEASSEHSRTRLTRRHPYVGPAWYSRSFTVATDADGLFHHLALERVHGEVTVWLDGLRVGRDDSLTTENRFLLGPLTAGAHRLTLLIDNSRFEAVGEANSWQGIPELAHSTTDHTQTNWNGVVGALLVEACRGRIARLEVHAAARRLRLKLELDAYDVDLHRPRFWRKPADDELLLSFQLAGRAEPWVLRRSVQITSAWTPLDFEVELPEGAARWDEFAPRVHALTVEWQRGGTPIDRQQTRFGIRHFESRDGRLWLNGRAVFIRGTLDCCIFPRTGYPPTDSETWRRNFRTIQAHGLNNVRFHSWCPPRAAFDAADDLGLLLQIETPVWAVLGTDPTLDRYIDSETARILRDYGNHPSFVMMAVGNEPYGAGLHAFLEHWVDRCQRADDRRVYTGASGWPVTQRAGYASLTPPRNHVWGQNLDSRLNANPLETVTDWGKWRDRVDLPVVTHEAGCWCAYPNLDEIPKYDGVLAPLNLEAIRDSLAQRGRLGQAQDLMLASGALQAKLYKEEMEAALRTRNFGGTQLLGLQDFPGQGTAPVGVLDAFWQAKPYFSADQFHEFAGPVVPLLRARRFVYTQGERIEGQLQLAHYGPSTFDQAAFRWQLLDARRQPVAEGKLRAGRLETGQLHDIGDIIIDTAPFSAPAEYELLVELDGTPYRNRWSLWVFERAVLPISLEIVREINRAVLKRAERGATLVVAPPPAAIRPNAALGFTTIFWNTAWTGNQEPHTLGLLNRTEHPLFRHFPARRHSDWHWWELLHGRRAFDVEGLRVHSVVRVIDDWNHNRDLALIAEARVGRGQLLLVGPDIESDLDKRPVARCLRNALALCAVARPVADAPLVTPADVLDWWSRMRADVSAAGIPKPGRHRTAASPTSEHK